MPTTAPLKRQFSRLGLVLASASILVVAPTQHADAKRLIRGSVGKWLDKREKEINRAAIDTGKGIEHLGQQIGKVGDRVGDQFSKGMCDIFAFGGNCSVSVGAGYDNQGPYTYSPTDPDTKFRPGEASTDPNIARMVANADYLRQSEIQTWEYQDNDVYGIARFLPPDKKLGAAWPNAATEVKPPTASGAIRPCGGQGCGGFLSVRSAGQNGIRFHAGVDYLTTVGEPIFSPITGFVERLKNPGKPGLGGLLLQNGLGYTASVYYITPTPEVSKSLATGVAPDGVSRKMKVEAGRTIIGYAQDLHPAYPAAVPQHVHVTLTDPAGDPVSPTGDTRIVKTPKFK